MSPLVNPRLHSDEGVRLPPPAKPAKDDAPTPRRCWWCGDAKDYRAYHDLEWGVPVVDDVRLFEKLCLEGFQCGLSWLTILRRREAFREVFFDFEPTLVAKMGSRDIDRLLGNQAIIRHRGKIEATISNAKATLDLLEECGSLASFLWQFEPRDHLSPQSKGDLAASTPESALMSKELKKHGFRFVGPTTCYSLMQAMGMVNDHLTTCDWHGKIEQLRSQLPARNPSISN